ncbi:hypothetical protein NL676_039718 [Syzygium grande]|nr:hypothetical protein NL676_039718 [Syzygium grande]
MNRGLPRRTRSDSADMNHGPSRGESGSWSDSPREKGLVESKEVSRSVSSGARPPARLVGRGGILRRPWQPLPHMRNLGVASFGVMQPQQPSPRVTTALT